MEPLALAGSEDYKGTGAHPPLQWPATIPRKNTVSNIIITYVTHTTNQAEQLAILRALEYIETIKMEDKTVTIYTDSQATLDSLKNNTNHTFLIEAIRKKLVEMGKAKWTIQFCWVRAHVGIQGNELADALAKEAATNADLTESYKKVPKRVVMSELTKMRVVSWQQEWDLTTKGAITKEYFPVVAERLNININITPNLTTIITGHCIRGPTFTDLN